MKKIDDPKKQATIALKKAQTHINNVLQMIEKDKYCVDIMTQIAATNGLLKSASEKILKNHMRTCFAEGMRNPDAVTREKLIQEILNVSSLSKRQ